METTVVRLDSSPSGKPRFRVVVEGMTYEARVSATGRILAVIGPLENKRPLKADYDLDRAEVFRWPDFNGRTKSAKTRRERFNTAAWALIDEALTVAEAAS